jgi:hypothetical protein
MNILELDSYNLADAVKFNQQLNPRIWQGNKMRPQVRAKLLQIAEDFKQSLGLTDLNVKDITLSGSNAGYTYTPHSDIDLHLVVDLPEADVSDVYRELFDAKKFQYNETHNIKIGGYDVELYVENANKSAVSQGIFSVINNDWINIPLKKRSTINDTAVKSKYDQIKHRIESAVKSKNLKRLTNTAVKIKKMRQAGLDRHGELGPENLAYKMLRSQGVIKKLYDARTEAKDRALSLKERTIEIDKPFRFTYGFKATEDVSANPSGVSPETKMFLSEEPKSDEDILTDFVEFCVAELTIEQMPRIRLRKDPQWPVRHKTFGRYNDDEKMLEVAWGQRHIMDVLRTVAHELTHKHQHERDGSDMGSDAGETGSPYENEANARAGVLMRDYAKLHPDYFAAGQTDDLAEASGYIPTKKQAKDPRFSMALTRDVRPGAVGKEANKLGLKTNSQGQPGLLMTGLANALREFKETGQLPLVYEDELFEINMSTGNLRREAAKTGAIAGMEFEMIVPNVEGGDVDDVDMEPDYEYDERCRSIEDAVNFFHDGDYNGRREAERLRARMSNDFTEWLDERIYRDWERGGEEYLEEWVPENVDESEWNPEGLEGEARAEALEELIANMHSDPGGSNAFDEFREENQDSYDESDWLDDEDLDRMSSIENQYSMSWPHWTSVGGGGEASIEDIAQEFENSIGRDTRASGNYHSGSVTRPSPTAQHYLVEPDGSLEADDSNDVGLEFVSPPLPIDEILSDLNKVKQWAKVYGCYTNDSTGLHINISVPNYSRENLDFVKLALLMGDEYVLDLFGRAGNTYAKPAIKMVRDQVRQKPDEAERLLDKMKGNLDSLASKAIHSGVTSKYTSINTKDGHIEFRSPGGDWLDQNFDQIENTLLRFTVAMSAALDPDMYREEYLKKLYKLLTQDQKGDSTIKYFSEYVAGKIPAAALRSFVKQARLERKLKKGDTDGKKYWWRVGRPGFGASAEVVATGKEEAIEKGKKEYPDWATANDMTAKPLRPYEEQSAKTARYEIYNKQTGNSVEDADGITNDEEALIHLNDYIEHGPHSLQRGQARDMFGIRTAGGVGIVDIDIPMASGRAATSPTGKWKITDGLGRYLYVFLPAENTRAKANELAALWARENNFDGNYQVEPVVEPVEEPASTPAPGSTADLAQQRAVPGTFTGAWQIIDNDGNEMHRFSGIGNNQRDANRVATQWVQNNGYAYGTEIEVVPVMSESIAEARSNPEQNVKSESGMKELMAVAETIADPENWAVSMTSEPKLGINPQVGISEDTPKGIYFYPLDYAVGMIQSRKPLPWGDNLPYIQLFQYNRSGEMTKETSVDPARLKQALLQYCPEEVIDQAFDEPEYDGTPYWFIYDCLSRLGKSDETNIVRWNKVLRDLGFTSVFDDGAGWIAHNEPTQGVVLDPRIIKQLKTISNKKQSRVVTPAVIERAIFDALDMELARNRAWQAYDPNGSKLRQAAKEYAKDPKFKPWFGKPGTEEIFDKASSWGRYGAVRLGQEAWDWYKTQQAQQPIVS